MLASSWRLPRNDASCEAVGHRHSTVPISNTTALTNTFHSLHELPAGDRRSHDDSIPSRPSSNMSRRLHTSPDDLRQSSTRYEQRVPSPNDNRFINTQSPQHSLTSSSRLHNAFKRPSRNASIDLHLQTDPSQDYARTASVSDIGRSSASNVIDFKDQSASSILSRGRPVQSLFSSFGTSPADQARPRSKQTSNSQFNPLSSNPLGPDTSRPSTARSIQASPDATHPRPRLHSPKSAQEQALDTATRFVKQTSRQPSRQELQYASSIPNMMPRYNSSNPLPDEKRGFFKRVFGQSASRANLVSADLVTSSISHSPNASRQASFATQPSRQQSQTMESMSQRQESIDSRSQLPGHSLNKKSSFFRRRKRSISDNTPAPALPGSIQSKDVSAKPSAGSLYQALNPYMVAPEGSLVTSTRPYAELETPTTPNDTASEVPHFPKKPSSDQRLRTDDAPSRLTTPTSSSAHTQGSPTASNTLRHAGPNIVNSPVLSQSRDQRSTPNLTVSGASPIPIQTEFVLTKGALDPGGAGRLWLHGSVDDKSSGDEHYITPSDTAPAETFHTPVDSTPEHARGPTYNTAYAGLAIKPLDSNSALQNALSDDKDAEKMRAQQIYYGDESTITKQQAATYLGDIKSANIDTLAFYMAIFDFGGKTILASLRMLCERLILKAESQQVDRILQSFADRWCESNPRHGFKLVDVVHTICYSLLLLNTDLHMADLDSRMSRGQFVKNTLPNIKRIVHEALQTSNAGTPNAPSAPWTSNANSPKSQGTSPHIPEVNRPGLSNRASSALLVGMGNNIRATNDKAVTTVSGGSALLIDDHFSGKSTDWYDELETVLKSFYTAIKHYPLPLNKTAPVQQTSNHPPPSLMPPGSMRRTPSIISVTPSENMSMRSKRTDLHSMASRWTKGRLRPKVYASSTVASSRTSLDDGWSRQSMGRTATTMTTDTYGSHSGADQGFQQSIGFANALSNAYTREDGTPASDDDVFNAQRFLLEDETLELAGAPWAKEGMVKHKYHLEEKGKKAKERDWSEGFAVVERGYLRLFSFNSKGGKSGSLGMRRPPQKGKAASIAPSVVGGGNWMQNAEQQACFLLRQTLASTLPPPGYSKARPHVWALSLPTGAVHLFQVGTPEIAKEFMSTANYWSARLSKEPLTGSVDNVEYGWSDTVMSQANAIAPNDDSAANENSAKSIGHKRQASGMSSKSHNDHASTRVKLPGDRMHIEDWKPPAQSMMASQLMAVDQLQGLRDYVSNVSSELTKHNDLRANLDLVVSLMLDW